jgi:predicted transcriptional regulator
MVIDIKVVTVKEQVMATLEKLPDTASLTEIREEIDILAAIEEGQRAIEEGRYSEASEVKARLRSWVEK